MYTFQAAIIFLTFFVFVGCKNKKDDTWDVIAVGIPTKISPEVAQINMGLYILKQTHEPLLKRNSTGNHVSNVLSKWTRSIDNKKFELCLKDHLKFSSDKKYTSKMFFRDIKRIVSKYDNSAQITTKNNCANISFQNASISFLEELSKYENAPTLNIDGMNWDYGLGKFQVKNFDADKIRLTRKAKVNNGYNSIVFHSYTGKDDKLLANQGIEDYNRVLIEHLPEKIISEYNSYPVSLLQTVNLVINHKDKEVRKILFNCIDVKKFRKNFMPKQPEFPNVKTVLPIGILGAESGLTDQICPDSIDKVKNIIFTNWNHSSSKLLKEYFDELKAKHDIEIKVKNVSMSDFVNTIFDNPHPYNLTVVAIDAVRTDYEAFFWPFNIF